MGFNPIDWVDDAIMMPGALDVVDDISGRSASKEARRAQESANASNMAIAERNIALQREFAQMGIRWRVDDARAAGVHPLAALGASGASFNPVTPLIDPLPSAKSWQHNLGQNVRSHILNRLDPTQRALSNLAVERAGLENDLLRLQMANMEAGQGGTVDTYLSGQSDSLNGSPTVVDLPLRRVVSDPKDPSKEAGAIQDYQIVRTKNGYAVVPAQGVKQAIEDSPMEYQWLLRAASRTYTLPDGRPAKMNPATGELSPIKPSRGFFHDTWSKFKEGPFGIFRRP